MKILSAATGPRWFTRGIAPASLLSLALVVLPRAEAASPPAKVAVPTQYGVTTLGILDNPGSSAVLRQVNGTGEAVGGFKNGKDDKASSAFLLSAAGLDLTTDQQSTDFSASYGINDLGEIAGALNVQNGIVPYRSVRHTGFQLLPLLDGDTNGAAYGINANGEAVGFSSGGSGVHAVWWTRKGVATGLPGLPGVPSAKALSINKKGDIAGYAGEGTTRPMLWPAKGSPTALNVLSSYTSSQADSVSDSGDVVGSATAYDATAVRMRAVLWPSGSTTPVDLGTLPGGTTSRARDVDANQIVVGTSDSSAGNHAFVWTSATGMQDLNSLSADSTIVLIDAVSINKLGVILAIGISKSDFPSSDPKDVEEHELPRHVVLLSPLK